MRAAPRAGGAAVGPGVSAAQELNCGFSAMALSLTGAPLFCRDHDAAVLLDFFLIMCDPSPLIP